MADQDLSKIDPTDVEIFKLTNMVRKNPKSLIPDLEEMLDLFEVDQNDQRTKKMRRSDGRSTILTKEGSQAVE